MLAIAKPKDSIAFSVSVLTHPGGAERMVSVMANYWATRGKSISVVSLDDPSEPLFYHFDPATKLFRLHASARSSSFVQAVARNLRRVRRLRAALRRADPDIIISVLTEMNVLTLLASVGLGIPVIVAEQTVAGVAPIRRVWDRLRSWTYPLAFRIVLPYQSAVHHFPPALRERIRVIPNPVQKQSVLATPGAARAAFRLIAVGRLAPEKNFDLLIRAFQRIASRRPDWTLTIYGEGPERHGLEGLSAELHLSDRISLPGTVANVPEKLADADLLVFSSLFEAFPMALCEAMAAGLPVVATRCPGGIVDIVREGIDGLLVPPADPVALAGALDSLMSDALRRARFGARAIEITERFALGKVMDLWEVTMMDPRPDT
jgi:glycosyltransferase involved in cell wall biosynthesis